MEKAIGAPKIIVQVIKASGKKERFNPDKVRGSLLRAGADRATAEKIILDVQSKAYDGITTRAVFKMVMKMLDERERSCASRYDLKGAIMRLGPSGFPFETFIAEILEEYGYSTTLRKKIKGECATHEIDIIAEENGKKYIIECKYQNSLGTHVDLKEVLYTNARFIDLNKGGHGFSGVWLACNTRGSLQAINYAECTGMRLLCWRYPKNQGLETLIEKRNLYPITMLRTLDKNSLERFSNAGLMLVRDLAKNDINKIKTKTGLSTKKLLRTIEEAKGF